MKDIIIMSRKEKGQVLVFEQLKRKEITQKLAGKQLGLSERQIRRKIKRYRKEGINGLLHRNRGRPSNKKIPEKKRLKVIDLYKNQFHDFGPTLASEKLEEMHEIKINAETLRLLLLKEGLWTKKRKRSSHRKWRERRKYYGELVQLDGSHHDWFEDRNKKCCLIGFIDDATSKIWCEFHKNESYESLARATKNYCLENGKPLALYSDRGGVFKVNINNPDCDKKTQYEKALKNLRIGIIHAKSPQAKGRVEKLFRTLQDRLIKEMRLCRISDIDTANKFLRKKFIDKYNNKFAVQAAKKGNLHCNTSERELYSAFCRREERILMNDYTIRCNNRLFQLQTQQRTIIRPKNKISVREYLDGKIKLFIRQTELFYTEITKAVFKISRKIKEKKHGNINIYIPKKDHPWRKINSMFFK